MIGVGDRERAQSLGLRAGQAGRGQRMLHYESGSLGPE